MYYRSIMMLKRTEAFIGGAWREDVEAKFEVRNPFNGNLVGEVSDCSEKHVEEAISAAWTAFQTNWRKTTAKERAGYLRKIGDIIIEKADELAAILTLENGKILAEAKGEVMFGAGFFHWFAEECRRPEGHLIPSPVGSKKFMTVEEPIGVAALICPWNFPFGMPARKMAAALAAGCTCVVKPGEDTPLTSLALAAITEMVNLPTGVVNVVTCSRENVAKVGEALCTNAKTGVVSFTGSCAVGEQLYSMCGRNIKRVCLELGGNAPFIVFKSADITAAVQGLMGSKFRNSGQTCVTANRILIAEEIYDEFMKLFTEAVQKMQYGDGMMSNIQQGPIINKRQLERVHRIVEETLAQGGELKMGGKIDETCYVPTIITGVTKTMSCWAEEIFGPVAGIMKFATEEEALELANDCDRGLAAYFYSSDYEQVWRVSSKLEAGLIGVNDVAISIPEAPFGGYKKSGIGKEGGRHGMDDYTQVKMIDMGGISKM